MRRNFSFAFSFIFRISTHTPHTGCDTFRLTYQNSVEISTHTPHTGCDSTAMYVYPNALYFNSHTPHGVRHVIGQPFHCRQDFNSHTPHGVRPGEVDAFTDDDSISTHTPHTGCDHINHHNKMTPFQFQLTHPTRGATGLYRRLPRISIHFNSHTPHGVRLFASDVIDMII